MLGPHHEVHLRLADFITEVDYMQLSVSTLVPKHKNRSLWIQFN